MTAVTREVLDAIRDKRIPQADTELFATFRPWARTPAELAAGVTPVNYAYPPGDLRRYGGAPGTQDNTAAMNLAVSVLTQIGGGIIDLPLAGEWRMNVTIAAHNIQIRMPGGRAEFDISCIRPFNIATGPALTFGDGVTDYRNCGLINCHVSGTDGTAGADTQSAKSASHCLLLKGGTILFQSLNSWFYNGIRTVSLEPSATNPITGARFIGGGARNDLHDSASARTIYGKRPADPGYYTDNIFLSFKINGPGDRTATGTKGFAAEFDGTGGPGIIGQFDDCYMDCAFDFDAKAATCHGILLTAGAGIRCNELTVDPGTTGAAVIQSTQALQDIGRFVFGTLHHGGQRMIFSAGGIDIPADADFFLYKQRSHTPTMAGQRYLVVAGDALAYPTTCYWEFQSTTGPDSLVGCDLEARKNVRVWGGNAALSGTLEANTASGGLFLAAQGANQDVRVVPNGTGVVRLEGAKTRPNLDNSQDLGAAGNRWAVVYAGTGAINTSDERVKDDIEDIPQAWLDAWGEVKWTRFRFKDAIVTKGDRARWHVGLIAQRVIEAFARHGVDAFAIGLVCYDEWETEFDDERDESGLTGRKVLSRPAGNRYAIRYDEAQALEAAYVRQQLQRFLDRSAPA